MRHGRIEGKGEHLPRGIVGNLPAVNSSPRGEYVCRCVCKLLLIIPRTIRWELHCRLSCISFHCLISLIAGFQCSNPWDVIRVSEDWKDLRSWKIQATNWGVFRVESLGFWGIAYLSLRDQEGFWEQLKNPRTILQVGRISGTDKCETGLDS